MTTDFYIGNSMACTMLNAHDFDCVRVASFGDWLLWQLPVIGLFVAVVAAAVATLLLLYHMSQS